MAKVIKSGKAASVNPLKMSSPLGASCAFLGINGCMPLMHGSQGCASLGLVLLGRHFRERIPIQTSALNEVTSILGGHENLEHSILNIRQRAKPTMIGICSTGLTETRGDDVAGHLELIRQLHPEVADTALVHVSTPDYIGAFQDGWANAVLAVISALAKPAETKNQKQINILAGCHLTVADLEEIRETAEAFGLHPIILPDISDSLDGHIPENFVPTALGGTSMSDLASLGESLVTIAIGEQMRPCASELEAQTSVPFVVFDRLTGLQACDRFVSYLSWLTDVPVPSKIRRHRSQLLDAMLDGHFSLGGKKVAIGAEPDLLWSLVNLLAEMGCSIEAAITTTDSPVLEDMPAQEVIIGDLEDLEHGAKGCDLMITHSHGRQAAARLDIPFHRAGLPIFDRLGAAHQLSVGYRGTRTLIFTIGNLFLDNTEPVHPAQWALPDSSLRAMADVKVEQPELKKESL